MKKLLCLLLMCMVFTSCGSNISKEEYETLQDDLRKKDEEISSLNSQLTQITNEKDEISKKLKESAETSLEYINKYNDIAYENLILDSVVSSQISNAVGKKIDDTYYQIISYSDYDENDIDSMIKEVGTCAQLLKYDKDTNFDKISIKYLDKNGKGLIEYILTKSNEGYELDGVCIDMERSSEIISAINN